MYLQINNAFTCRDVVRGKKSPSSVSTAPPERCMVLLSFFREERLLTSADDFLLGDVAGVDLLCEFVNGCVGVLVCVGVHISLQGFQLFCRKGE